MAGTLIVSNITTDTDNTFIVRSNTGTTLFSANTTGIDVANSIGSTAITNDKILSVANTKITGNIISSQITPTVSLYGTTSLGKDTTDYVNIVGGSGTARVDATGGNTDVNLSLATKGVGSVYFWRGGYGGTQMALLNQYGLGLGATTPSSGTGIAFPATQSASSDANTLDDYEEGTWTPTDNSGAGLTWSSYSANYVKVGQIVIAWCQINYPATANGNGAAIAGLPFTVAGQDQYGGFTRYSTSQYVYPTLAQSGTYGSLYNTSGGQITNATLSSKRVDFTYVYRSNA